MKRSLFVFITLLLTGSASTAQSLMVPPGAETDTSVTLLWDHPSVDSQDLSYEVMLNGKPAGRTEKTFYTVKGLSPDTSYSFAVRYKDKNGRFCPVDDKITHTTRKKGKTFNICDFGAVGDGKTKNTKAIQKAIGACTVGGMVYIPAGKFVSGALFLKSDMTLYIATGGTLQGSSELADYRPFIMNRYSGWEMKTYASLINAGRIDNDGPFNVTNLSIRGEGSIRGGGNALGKAMLEKDGYYSRARLLCLMNCRNVNIQGLTLENSPSWTLHYLYSKNITCHGLTIISKGIRNGDGIDPDSSINSYIFDCEITTSDDCIAIKSGKNPEGNRIGKPTANVFVSYCKFEGHGMSIGTEMSGGVSNVIVRNSEIMPDDLNGLQIKVPVERGGYVRDIRVQNCKMSQVKIITKLSYNTGYDPAPEIPFIGDMEFVNLDMEDALTKKPAILIDGYKAHPANTANISFRNVSMADNTTVALKDCTDISFENVLTTEGKKPEFETRNVKGYR